MSINNYLPLPKATLLCLIISFHLLSKTFPFIRPLQYSFQIKNGEKKVDSKALFVKPSTDTCIEMKEIPKTQIAFPGGGIYFYWQIGAASYLRDIQKYDLSKVMFTGASAGALAATLTITNVDFNQTTESALQLAEDAGIWDRPLGLQGIWGSLIKKWLDDLLPQNALDLVEGRLTLLVTPVPFFGKTRVSSFLSREDLIQCNMASVHLPWFLDGKLTSNFRNQPHIDGSFLAGMNDYFQQPMDSSSPLSKKSMITLDYQLDETLSSKGLDFVSAKPKDFIWSLIESGRNHAKRMEEKGEFENLIKL